MSGGFGNFLGSTPYWDTPIEYRYFQYKTKQVAENKTMTIKMKPIDLTTKEAQALFGGKEKFEVSSITSSDGMCVEVELVKPIPPKPQVRVEYEKVTESIFDLKDEFERGELVFHDRDEYIGIVGADNLCKFYADGNVYRLVEKPVDWQKSLLDFLYTQPVGEEALEEQLASELSNMPWKHTSTEDFLEMCRVALRATGELPPKGDL